MDGATGGVPGVLPAGQVAMVRLAAPAAVWSAYARPLRASSRAAAQGAATHWWAEETRARHPPLPSAEHTTPTAAQLAVAYRRLGIVPPATCEAEAAARDAREAWAVEEGAEPAGLPPALLATAARVAALPGVEGRPPPTPLALLVTAAALCAAWAAARHRAAMAVIAAVPLWPPAQLVRWHLDRGEAVPCGLPGSGWPAAVCNNNE